MASQWLNFLQNLGDWHGTFTSLRPNGELKGNTYTILNLVKGDEDHCGNVTMVRFRLRRFSDADRQGEPMSDHCQDYRSLGRQVVFFESGTFCKGTLQLAPGIASGAEFGFVAGDRRHRLVMLHDAEGRPDQLVLIREVRANSDAPERPPLGDDQLIGSWHGVAATVTSDWPEPDRSDITLEVTPEWLNQLLLLPDGGYGLVPQQVSHRTSVELEAGWLLAPDRLERLIRRYDSSGAWQSSTHQCLVRR
jgi:hypothetical protein